MFPLVIGSGTLCGLGIFFLVRELIPATPSLQAAVSRLNGTDKAVVYETSDDDVTLAQRAGVWATRRISPRVLNWAGPSRQDMNLLGRSMTLHYGEKALSAVVALLLAPILVMLFAVLGSGVPFTVPAGVSLLLGLIAWVMPDLLMKSKAEKARSHFRRAVATYLELLAIERASGSGVNQATTGAAEVAQSWPFRRIDQALELGRWDGKAPWVALRQLADDVNVTELTDVADILEQAGRDGSAIHDQLQSRAEAMRDAQLDVEQQIAHDATVRMSIPGTLTVFVYFAALLAPALLAMIVEANR